MRLLPSLSLLPALLALVSLGAPLSADTIVRTDGKLVEGVRVLEDGLTAVTYREGNTTKTLESDKVLRIKFDKFPRLVDEAEAAIVGDDPEGAVVLLDTFVEGQIAKPNEPRKWAAPYANWRSIQIRMANADTPGVVEKAQQLIANFADSRFVPRAYLAKAQAEAMLGDGAKAKKSLETLLNLISSKGLSKRYDLETRLALLRVDAATGAEAKREALAQLASDAREFPTVKNRILVAEGETWVAQAEKDAGNRDELLSEARSVFERILSRQDEAEPETLAGAYTGLGDVAYYAAGDDEAQLHAARMHYLRVAIVYADEVQYVPKCLFQALLVSNKLADTDKKRDMKRELLRRYPNSPYTQKAKSY